MQRTIVVVDDEKLVVYGICSILSGVNSGFTVTATGSCGEEGLRLCIEKSPDILLTDIGMSGMDGLELIDKVKQTNPEMKVVVLSCHDEYNLVHKAFMLGADDYILKKDIDKLNLCKLLNRILPENAVREGTTQRGALIKPLSAAMDFKPEKPGSMGIIGFKCKNQQNNSELMWQPDIPMLQQLLNDDISPYGEYYLGLKHDLVIYFPGFNLDEKIKLEKLLGKARGAAEKYINHMVFIAEYIMKPAENLSEAYNCGLEILKGMFYQSDSAILTDGMSRPDRNSNLAFELTTGNIEENWRDALERYLQKARQKLIDPDSVKSELNFAIKHLLYRLEENAESDFNPALAEALSVYHRKILNFNDVELLRKWSLDFLAGITEELRARQKRSRTVYNAKLYVNTHLGADLRLSTIAGILAVNPNHLSTTFRKTTDLSYIEYVNKKRINRACELLESTDLTAKEIAFQCGYENPNYFSRIFKKVMNITVSEYRSSGTSNL